jgi:hypothetical protein
MTLLSFHKFADVTWYLMLMMLLWHSSLRLTYLQGCATKLSIWKHASIFENKKQGWKRKCHYTQRKLLARVSTLGGLCSWPLLISLLLQRADRRWDVTSSQGPERHRTHAWRWAARLVRELITAVGGLHPGEGGVMTKLAGEHAAAMWSTPFASVARPARRPPLLCPTDLSRHRWGGQ